MKYTKKDISNIISGLYNNYYKYYESVYYEYIVEAILNTFYDYKNKKALTIDEIHDNISKNYI